MTTSTLSQDFFWTFHRLQQPLSNNTSTIPSSSTSSSSLAATTQPTVNISMPPVPLQLQNMTQSQQVFSIATGIGVYSPSHPNLNSCSRWSSARLPSQLWMDWSSRSMASTTFIWTASKTPWPPDLNINGQQFRLKLLEFHILLMTMPHVINLRQGGW